MTDSAIRWAILGIDRTMPSGRDRRKSKTNLELENVLHTVEFLLVSMGKLKH